MTIADPILHHAFELFPQGGGETEFFGAWQEAGLYWVWSGGIPLGAPPRAVLEKLEQEIVEFKAGGHLAHPIFAGKLHHINHLFGYWHESDADRIWLQVPRQQTVVHALVWGGKSGVHKRDRLLWFCPRCGERLADREIDTGKSGLEGFIAAQLDAVRQFNSAAEKRKCRSCGFVHPEAYGFHPQDDTAAEKASRERW
jgi:rubredoxin